MGTRYQLALWCLLLKLPVSRSDSMEYEALAGRGMVLGIAQRILTLGIVVLMVLKPPLWS